MGAQIDRWIAAADASGWQARLVFKKGLGIGD